MPIYSEYRNKIKSGDLLIWSADKIRSARDLQLKIVQIFTQSSYDHVALAWWCGNRLFVSEATPPQVRLYPLSKLSPFYHVSMDIDWKDSYDDYIVERVGEYYSIYQALISYFTVPADDREWQCAEYVRSFYEKIGLEAEWGDTPKSIVETALKVSGNGLIRVS